MSWFSVCPVEPIHKFELLGLLVGLAVYNGVTLPVTFPRILYKKLLGMEATSLDDIKDGWFSLASGLQELLDWNQGDVGDVFLRTYDFSYEAFGAVKNVNMLKAKETGLEFLEDKIVRLPASSRQKKKEKKEKKFDADAVEGLLELQNWLPVPAEQERDTWLGGLNEVLDVLNRADPPESPESPEIEESPERQRGYEITLTEWPGEEAWEDVEEAEARRQSLGVDAAAAAAAAGESERVGAGEAEVADEVEETSRTGVEMSFVELTAESVQEESSRAKDEELAKARAEAEAEASRAEAEASAAAAAAAAAADDTTGEKEGEIFLDGERSSNTSEGRDMPEGSSRFTESWHEAEEEGELVTNSNREQYVKDYISWLTDRSIRRQYQAFEKGFFAVLDPKALGVCCHIPPPPLFFSSNS